MISIPVLTLKRLPQYLELLYGFEHEGQDTISATRLAELTGVHMTQVRKDIALTGVVGIPKVGHKVRDLIESIESCLNWKDHSSAFLVGVGRLGSSLLGYSEFKRKGLNIVAGFDTDPSVAGSLVDGVIVHPMDKFANLCRRMKVHIGILTVPADQAQATAELMVESGILAIWNFTPTLLQLDEGIIVEDVDMSASLAVLSRRLSEKYEQDSQQDNKSKNKKNTIDQEKQ
ncbi:MAG: redox-sensing transcriptional repressor Rex [Candidatus Cloacimonadaceae bacterium]|jgi:redox-sensing transcriptional repressor